MSDFNWHTNISARITKLILQHHLMVKDGKAMDDDLDEWLKQQDPQLFKEYQIVEACIYLQDQPEKNPNAVEMIINHFKYLVDNKIVIPHIINETLAHLFSRYQTIPNVKTLDQAFKLKNVKGGQAKNKLLSQIVLDLTAIIIEYEQEKYSAIETLNQMYINKDPTGTTEEIPTSTLEEMFQEQKQEALTTYHIRSRLGLTDSDPSNYSEIAKKLIGKYWTTKTDIFQIAKDYYTTDE